LFLAWSFSCCNPPGERLQGILDITCSHWQQRWKGIQLAEFGFVFVTGEEQDFAA
jgi:hypothetical protein